MVRILSLAGLATVLALPLSLTAQARNAAEGTPYTHNHGEFTAYADYLRFAPSESAKPTNFLGLGGRIGFNVHPNIALEGEMSYDFARNYTSISKNGGTVGGSSTTVVSKIRPLTGLFGPKFQFGTTGPFRAFLTGKVGFLEMTSSNASPSTTTFGNSFNNFGGNGTYVSVYPGGGLEAFFGPIGIRAEIGDEIVMHNGPNNNIRFTFGPSIRF